MKKNIILISLFLTTPFYFANANTNHTQIQTTELIDPTTKSKVNNSYQVNIPSLLTLGEAQKFLGQVSPKLASEYANLVAKEKQREAVKTLDEPVVFARATANAYKLQKDIDLADMKNNVSDGINNKQNQILDKLNNGLGLGANAIQIPPIGNHITKRLPDSYDFQRSDQSINTGIGFVWPVYNAGRTKALGNLLDARTFEAEAHAKMTENQLYTTLVERYFNAQLAMIGASLRKEALNTIKKADHTAERFYEEGLISLVERMEAQTALADAKSEYIKARNTSRLAMMSLQRLLRTTYQIKPTTPLFISTKPLQPLEYYQDIALNHHPALKLVQAKKQQAEQSRNLSDTKYKPNIAMFGYADVDKKPSWLAGVSATWSFSGGLDKSAMMASSDAQARQAELSSIELKDNLLLLVEKNWHDVNNAQARYQALKTNIDLSYKVLQMRKVGFQEGLNTVLDVVQAQTLYIKASTQQAQAVNDYVQALAKLMEACGTPLDFNNYLKQADIKLPALYPTQAETKPKRRNFAVKRPNK